MTAVLLDIGGVILPEDELYARLFQSTKAALRNAGVHVSDEEFDDAVRKCIASFVPGLREALIWHFTKPDMGKFAAVVSAAKWDEGPRDPRPGIRELLEEFSASCTLALAANASGAIRSVLAEHDLLRYFKSVEVSGDLPFAKPDPRFFEHILRNCGVGPEEAIMIGDRLDNDIIPAKLLGMKTILYKTGPYAILEPRTPDEIPDAAVTSVDDLRAALLKFLAA